MSLSPADRVAAYRALGLDLHVEHGVLRARGDAAIIAAARPALRLHRAALLSYIISTTGSAVNPPRGSDRDTAAVRLHAGAAGLGAPTQSLIPSPVPRS